MNVHHIGYLVKKGEKAAQAFEALGYEREGGWTHDEVRRVDILFLQKDCLLYTSPSPRDCS